MMNDFPDFSHHCYRVERELGHNRAGGRVTYLAVHTETHQPVVIKQFQFARTGASWSDYDAYDREIQLLKELDHPGIPRYLDAFQTDDGFCMVQEYKAAVSLAEARSYQPDDIKHIAIAALEVLIYLQNRIPPIIHRDIKPENILIDPQGKVYLVDFGFARVGGGEVGVSSVVKGTLGFMPPEQLFNRQLTEASDLYGLGMTLICLLTGTKSDRIGDLVDISYRVSFKHLVPKLNLHWVSWLEKMVEPRLKDRFPNAVAALAAIPASPLRPPEAQFSQSSLVFRASRVGERLTQSVLITNPIPDTVLQGQWAVDVHPNDPSAELYRWIAIAPEQFEGNEIECHITVDTSKLMTGKTYQRRLLLHANTLAKTYPLTLQIYTRPLATQLDWVPFAFLSLLCLFSIGMSWTLAWVVRIMSTVADSSVAAAFGAVLGAAMGLELAAWMMRSSGWRMGASASTMSAVIVGAGALLSAVSGVISNFGSVVATGAITGVIGGTVSGVAIATSVEHLIARGTIRGAAVFATLLTTAFGVSLGLGFSLGFASAVITALLTTSGLVLAVLMAHLQLRQMNSTLQRRKMERHLIKP